jgi:hypothetical protein
MGRREGPVVSEVNKQSGHYEINADEVYMNIMIPRHTEFVPCRVEFVVESKDQGWSRYPEEHGQRSSHTWGEASVGDSSTRHHVYTNIHAGHSYETQTIVFDKDSALVRELASASLAGDTTLRFHARSQYPGWVNSINSAEVKVQYEPHH